SVNFWDLCRHRVTTVSCGNLRRDVLRSNATQAGNWHSHGAGGTNSGCAQTDRAERNEAGAPRCGRWTGGSHRTDTVDGKFPLWSVANRCVDAGNCLSRSDTGCADRVLYTSTARNEARSAGGAEIRISKGDEMGTIWQDISYGLRMLLKSPSVSVVATIALALGIGANTAIFSVVNAVLLRPLPYPNSEALMSVFEKDQTR